MSAVPRRIAIFGATSRIAIEAARLWLASGAHLVVVAHNAERLRMLSDDLSIRAGGLVQVDAVTADLADLDALPALWKSLADRFPDLDGVLIAHQSLPDQARCEAEPGPMLQAIRVNALSAMSLLTVIANDFEGRGHGVIGVLGSVAGDRGRRDNYVYGAAKGMLAVFLQGLRDRLQTSGVTVITLKTGPMATSMTPDPHAPGARWASPERVARGIVHAFERRRQVVYLPWFWRPVQWAMHLIPEPLLKRLSP